LRHQMRIDKVWYPKVVSRRGTHPGGTQTWKITLERIEENEEEEPRTAKKPKGCREKEARRAR